MDYDQTIHKAEQIVRELEQSEAISLETYKQKSAEVKQLLDLCEQQLIDIEKQLLV